jgi:hypothetical protein
MAKIDSSQRLETRREIVWFIVPEDDLTQSLPEGKHPGFESEDRLQKSSVAKLGWHVINNT